VIIEFFAKLPVFKRLIPSIGIRVLKLFNKNRNFFKIGNIDFFLDFLDPVDRQIIIHKNYEFDQINFLEEQMNKYIFSHFLDIGANSGYYSFYFAEKYKNLKIKAFEPNNDAFNKFNKTLVKNSFQNVKIFNFGLSDMEKKTKMKSMIKHGQAHSNSIIFDDRYDFDLQNYKVFDAILKVGDNFLNFKNKRLCIKIDVEGHEINTLRGLINNINRNKCLISIEIGNAKFNEVDNFLKKNNFKQIFKSKYRLDYGYINFKPEVN
jgi:FkbM family methyltransferase